MYNEGAGLKESSWKPRSAEETANFLNENFGPDECDRLALIAAMINVAVYKNSRTKLSSGPSSARGANDAP
jgi:hypothetical protein